MIAVMVAIHAIVVVSFFAFCSGSFVQVIQSLHSLAFLVLLADAMFSSELPSFPLLLVFDDSLKDEDSSNGLAMILRL